MTCRRPAISPALFVVALAGGCGEAAPSFQDPSLAKGGGGPGPSVSTADPAWAPQDVTLDVRVLGSGFDVGASAEWAIDGQPNPAYVRTNGTSFVNSGELVANITISADAPTVLYDIVVTLAGGKKGVGTEKFEVAPKGSTNSRFTNPRGTYEIYDLTGLSGGGLWGDHRSANGSSTAGPSIYDDGQCRVTVQFFLNNDGDATMDPIAARNQKCSPQRALTVHFGTPLSGPAVPSQTAGHFLNVHEVLCASSVDGCGFPPGAGDDPWEPTIGQPAERVFRITVRGSGPSQLPCSFVRYDDRYSVGGLTGRRILVSRLSDREWLAESQPDGLGRHIAYCEQYSDTGVPALTGAYDIPFRIKVIQK